MKHIKQLHGRLGLEQRLRVAQKIRLVDRRPLSGNDLVKRFLQEGDILRIIQLEILKNRVSLQLLGIGNRFVVRDDLFSFYGRGFRLFYDLDRLRSCGCRCGCWCRRWFVYFNRDLGNPIERHLRDHL